MIDDKFAFNAQVMVPEFDPLAPDVIDSQLPPAVTAAVHAMVPLPVLDTLNVVDPAKLITFCVIGLTESVGTPSCVTVTSFGLPVAPAAVMWIVPVREAFVVLASKAQVMVPVSVPLLPDEMVSQLADITSAVHGIVPDPVFDTLKVVVPDDLPTFCSVGLTDSDGTPSCVTVTSFGLPVAPVAVMRIVPVREAVVVLASKAQEMVPESVPLLPDEMVSQLADITSAVQGMVSVPAFETLNVVDPISFDASRWVGSTESTG